MKGESAIRARQDACVKACEGLADPSVVPELLAAVKLAHVVLDFGMPPTSTIAEKQAHLDMIAAIIAKAEGH